MPRTRRGVGWWLVPLVDLASSSIALTVVALLTGTDLFPALPLAPLLLVGVYGALGVYGSSPSRNGDDGRAWPVIRLLVAALFAWSASLLSGLDGAAQLGLWIGFVACAPTSRCAPTPGSWPPCRPAATTRRRRRASAPSKSSTATAPTGS
jgi:hypothetical protein